MIQKSHEAADVKHAAAGRWVEILCHLGGVDESSLDGRHHPCPKCGGTDRFRMIDADAGACFCNKCFNQENGDGFAALQWLNGWSFPEAISAVAEHLGTAAPANGKPAAVDLIDQVCRSKRMPRDAFEKFGVKVVDGRFGKVVRVDVYNEKGVVHAHFDLTPKDKGFFKAGKGSAGLFLPARAPKPDETWCLVEGCKDSAALVGVGFNACGLPTSRLAKKFQPLFRDVHVVIVPDRDKAGEDGANMTAALLHGMAATVKIATLPTGYRESKGDDVRDVLASQGEEVVRRIIEEAPEWKPPQSNESASGSRISNMKEVVNEEDETVSVPAHINEILDATANATGNWPRRMNDALFVDDEHGVNFLTKCEALFGYFQRQKGGVDWRNGATAVGKAELFHELRRTATQYKAVENLPHFPPMAGHYYSCKTVQPGDGKMLDALVDRFNPTTDIDRDLILAMFVTPFLGTAGGTRPAWVITSDDGRGSGKTKLAEMVSLVAGGALQVSHGEDITKLKERLLTPSSLTKRVVVLDNIKSLKFSWDDLEGLITAPIISGRQLYHGDFERPNMLVWLLTLNGASLSTDMAQRVITVQISRPTRSGDWEEKTRAFIADNHAAILADIAAFFQRERFPLAKFTRWATWEREVIERLPEPGDAQAAYMERQAAADVEEEESAIIADYFRERLEDLGYDADTDRIHIPTTIATDWFRTATGDRSKTTTAVSRTLNQMQKEGRLTKIMANPSRHLSRGFLWIGDESGDSDCLSDLDTRIQYGCGTRGTLGTL